MTSAFGEFPYSLQRRNLGRPNCFKKKINKGKGTEGKVDRKKTAWERKAEGRKLTY
jgi:hypothetical protein